MTQRRKMTPTGMGYLYEAANAFHVRYYTQEVGEDGQLHRVQKSHKLCKRDAKHPNMGCKAVRDLRQQFMAGISAKEPSAKDMPIHQFWDRYITWCSEVRKDGTTRKRPNTIARYKYVYQHRLEKHFGKLMLSEYTPEMGTSYLDSLSAKLALNSLRDIKTVGSAIFKRAVKAKCISVNPWHEVELPEDAMRYETGHYTEAEYDAIIEALKSRLDAQTIFAIACYCGLRKGEIEGLKWEDFDSGMTQVQIQRQQSRGIIGPPKTDASIAPVRVPHQARIFLQAWWEKKGKPTTGWVFLNRFGKDPIDLHYLALVIRPLLQKAEPPIKWKGWHACRRSCVTWVIENTKGNAALAQQHARHKHMSTTVNIYKKAISAEGYKQGILEAFPEPKLLTK